MTITLCGSVLFLPQMIDISNRLRIDYKITALLPHKAEYWVKTNDLKDTPNAKEKKAYMEKHLHKIKRSDAILVVNIDKNGKKNYVGGNTFLEMGFAFAYNKPIFVWNDLPEESSYYDELQGMMPHVIHQDLAVIENFRSEPV